MALPRYLMTDAFAARPSRDCCRAAPRAASMSPSERWLLARPTAGGRAALAATPSRAVLYRGVVVDAVTGAPVEGAVVTAQDTAVTTDADGAFAIEGERRRSSPARHGLRARRRSPLPIRVAAPPRIALTPLRPKALYLSLYGVRDRELREGALALIDSTELNALVIDVKGDIGKLLHRTALPLAAEAGAETASPVESLTALVETLHERGIYLDRAHRRLQGSAAGAGAAGPGGEDRGRRGLARPRAAAPGPIPSAPRCGTTTSTSRSRPRAPGSTRSSSTTSAFPDRVGLRLRAARAPQPNRIDAITGVPGRGAAAARCPTTSSSPPTSSATCAGTSTTRRSASASRTSPPRSTYVSPMLYPSSFQFGIPGFRDPVAHPYEIVYLSLARARQRSGATALRFRPWLQAFRDYAFDRRSFDEDEMRAQIRAAEAFGSDGWMLWNPHNLYSSATGCARRRTADCVSAWHWTRREAAAGRARQIASAWLRRRGGSASAWPAVATPALVAAGPLEAIAGIVDDEMRAGRIPGAVVLVGTGGAIVYRRAFGGAQLRARRAADDARTRSSIWRRSPR